MSFMIPGILMFIMVYGVAKFFNGSVLSLCIQIILGVSIFSIGTMLCFIITKDEMLYKIGRLFLKSKRKGQ